MRGGDGNDTYIVDNLGDVVEEFFDDVTSGYDTVQSSVSFTLSYGIDRLILTGTGSNSGTGNNLDNEIQGNSGTIRSMGLAATTPSRAAMASTPSTAVTATTPSVAVPERTLWMAGMTSTR